MWFSFESLGSQHKISLFTKTLCCDYATNPLVYAVTVRFRNADWLFEHYSNIKTSRSAKKKDSTFHQSPCLYMSNVSSMLCPPQRLLIPASSFKCHALHHFSIHTALTFNIDGTLGMKVFETVKMATGQEPVEWEVKSSSYSNTSATWRWVF